MSTQHNDDWALEGMTRDRQSITRDWQVIGRAPIEGVQVREVKHVFSGYGSLVELWRADWELDEHGVDQVFQSSLRPGGYSAWHAHARTTDRLFVTQGCIRFVLFDSRRSSASHGELNEIVVAVERPALIVVPPRVWHGVFNEGPEPAHLVNLVDCAYAYEGPDHWRVPFGDPQIPYPRSP